MININIINFIIIFFMVAITSSSSSSEAALFLTVLFTHNKAKACQFQQIYSLQCYPKACPWLALQIKYKVLMKVFLQSLTCCWSQRQRKSLWLRRLIPLFPFLRHLCHLDAEGVQGTGEDRDGKNVLPFVGREEGWGRGIASKVQ